MKIEKIEKMETVAFQELLKRTPDAFEAVAVLGQRSRQIVNRRMIERMQLQQDLEEEEIEETFEPLEENENYVEEEKEAVLAMQDLFEGRLTWAFRPAGGDIEEESGDSKGS